MPEGGWFTVDGLEYMFVCLITVFLTLSEPPCSIILTCNVFILDVDIYVLCISIYILFWVTFICVHLYIDFINTTGHMCIYLYV